MKVRELIELLDKCNQDAEITSVDCRYFQKEFYYPIMLEYLKVDNDTLEQHEVSSLAANVILLH